MTVLITGASGAVGTKLSNYLIEKGYAVIGVDISPPRLINSGYSHIYADITRSLNLPKVDAVCHLAALIEVGESMNHPDRYYQVNVLGTFNVLEYVRNAHIPKFIFSSTGAIGGEEARGQELSGDLTESDESPGLSKGSTRGHCTQEHCTQEDPTRTHPTRTHPTRTYPAQEQPTQEQPTQEDPTRTHSTQTHPTRTPSSVYARTKLAAENMIKDYASAYGFSATILRFFNASGMADIKYPPIHLIASLVDKSINNLPIVVFGDDYPTRDGTCIRDYVSINDICNAIYLSIKGSQGVNTYNIGSGRGNSVLEVINAVEYLSGKKFDVQVLPRRSGDSPSLVADYSVIKKELGWKPTQTLEDMIRSTFDEYAVKRYHNERV
jgi:UDP-glucose 4-epimerase